MEDASCHGRSLTRGTVEKRKGRGIKGREEREAEEGVGFSRDIIQGNGEKERKNLCSK